MARLQILQLPEGASDEQPPFLLVIDQAEPATDPLGDEKPLPLPDGLAEQVGARAVLVFNETIDIPANGIASVRDDGLGGMTQSRDEWMAAAIAAQDRLERHRQTRDAHKTALTDALGMDRLRDWDDIINAARGLRREHDHQRAAIDAVRSLHRPVESPHGSVPGLICADCTNTDNAPIAHPCATVRTLGIKHSEGKPEPGTP